MYEQTLFQAVSSELILFTRFGPTILLLSIGIAVYAAIVGTFYNYLSRRILYQTSAENSNTVSRAIHGFGEIGAIFLKYTILFPAITFLWFVLLSTLLFLLSNGVEIETVFITSISAVAAIRLLAYYNESLSGDVAKLLPLALLGIILVEPTRFSWSIVQNHLTQLAGALPEFVSFIAVAIIIEWTLRITYEIFSILKPKKHLTKNTRKKNKQ